MNIKIIEKYVYNIIFVYIFAFIIRRRRILSSLVLCVCKRINDGHMGHFWCKGRHISCTTYKHTRTHTRVRMQT